MAGYGFLLRDFAGGRMGIVAPVSGVLATAIPVMFAAFTEGLPHGLQSLGSGLALVSIWMLSRPEKLGSRPEGLGMALLAGVEFGGFFTALEQVGESAVFWPLAAMRLTACVLMVAFALSARRSLISKINSINHRITKGSPEKGDKNGQGKQETKKLVIQ